MASTIEDIIDEIMEYIDSCKPSAFSSSKIIVNRDDIDNLLSELRNTTPVEIRRYQKIISNQEAILADAQAKADAIIAQAQIQTNELVSEHQIMQQAYAQANEVVMIATKQAQDMLDKATQDANDIRTGAVAYTDELLKSVQDVLVHSMDTTRTRSEQYLNQMQGYLDVVTKNRLELAPEAESAIPDVPQNQTSGPFKETLDENKTEDVPSIDVPEEFFKKD
jgi:vacuolar-type H+-ATPase subunit H